jgi:1-acyl-sn-glycerol-3-phosphate acyltransferase
MYHAMRWLVGLALGFYFRRIERFHVERIPGQGPVLFTSNHPNSLTDSFVIGASVGRKVNFVATVQLFRVTPLRWLLTRCGVIPINRVQDNARGMRGVAETFAACFRVLERGEAVGIFPEGITYEDSQLKEIKSGAARMALELEHKHGGKLGLRIMPVGLTFSAKEVYRSDALVNFGEPILVSSFLSDYEAARKQCIRTLTEEIEQRLQALIVHLPELEQARVVEGVKRLYFEKPVIGKIRLPAGAEQPDEVRQMQRIVAAVKTIYVDQPERAEAFAAKLARYETWLGRLRISDRDLALFENKRGAARQSFGVALLGLVLAPVALFGWLHRLLPYLVIRWAVGHLTEEGKRKAQTSTTAIMAGIVVFAVFYGAFIAGFHALFGWPASLWYGLSLPVASLAAFYYVRELRKFSVGLRNSLRLIRAPSAARRLLALRGELIAEIASVQGESATAPAAQ